MGLTAKQGDCLNATWPCFLLTRHRCISIQGFVAAGLVVVANVFGQHVVKMILAQDDHMIQAVSADGTDHSFRVRILPGAIRRDTDLFNIHIDHGFNKSVAIDFVIVPQEIARFRIPRKRLSNLEGSPLDCGLWIQKQYNPEAPIPSPCAALPKYDSLVSYGQ